MCKQCEQQTATREDRWTEIGRYYGFPPCCIRQFCNHHDKDRPERSQAGNGTGFIPCTRHARMINAGHIKLEDLIRGRKCPETFPNDTLRQVEKDLPHLF